MTPDPSILCHPNIPKPLHGINPRTIYGQIWWDTQRRKAYEAAGLCCEACGVHKYDAKLHKWLEAHEFYEYDMRNGRLTFLKLVALCHYCHNFIHSGRLQILRDTDQITAATYSAITKHGMDLLKTAGLTARWKARHDAPETVSWMDWRMIVDGKEYGPSSSSFRAWQAGDWKRWTPTTKITRPRGRLVWSNEGADFENAGITDDWGMGMGAYDPD